jgi:NAD(P)H-hydrate epimerase
MNRLPRHVFSAGQVRAMDRHAIEHLGVAGYTLMTRAGEAALDLLGESWPAARRITVLCGSGNNAGDGYVLARLARAAGFTVLTAALGDATRLAGDAARAYADFSSAGGVAATFDPAMLAETDVVVDALLGTGLDRDVGGAFAACIEAVNACDTPVLSLDIPSGLQADDGRVMGCAVRATRTITFVGLKSGLYLGAAADHVGSLSFAGLGVGEFDAIGPPVLLRAGPAEVSRALPARRRAAHKGDFGRVLVVGGGEGMPGAVRLAAEAALRAGAGLVTVATQAANVAAVVGSRPEIICHGVASEAQARPLMAAADVVAIGPGLGQSDWARGLMEAALASGKPLVVDADGLNLLAASPWKGPRWVLTPHPGEAGRLLGSSAAAVQADRLAALHGLAERYGGVVLLKGAGSLVLGPGGQAWVCDAGNPGMAVAGMGDVLTGVIAGLIAQCQDLELAAVAGMWIHAHAGDLAAADGLRGLLASDLLERLRACVNPA